MLSVLHVAPRAQKKRRFPSNAPNLTTTQHHADAIAYVQRFWLHVKRIRGATVSTHPAPVAPHGDIACGPVGTSPAVPGLSAPVPFQPVLSRFFRPFPEDLALWARCQL